MVFQCVLILHSKKLVKKKNAPFYEEKNNYICIVSLYNPGMISSKAKSCMKHCVYSSLNETMKNDVCVIKVDLFNVCIYYNFVKQRCDINIYILLYCH